MKRSIRFLSLLLCVLLSLPTFGCAKAEEIDLTVAQSNAGTLYIQIPEDATAQTLYARDRLVFFVQEKLGVTLDSGSEPNGECVLVLGNVGDEVCTKLAKKLKGLGEYAVRASGDRITVLADNEAFLYDAVEYLIEKMSVTASEIRLQGTVDCISAGNTASLRYMFTQSTVLESTSTRFGTLPFHPEDIRGTQGGCRVGNYHYQTYIKNDKESNELNNICYIGKYDLTTQTVVQYSERLDLNHANDVTYNSRTNELVVVHNKPRYTQLSIIDPDTLTLKRTVDLPGPVYAVTYNATRDEYAVGRSNSQNIHRVTNDFKFVTKDPYTATPTTKTYTTQGICSDDTFIYCVLYDGLHAKTSAMQNVITVYDWYGNYVGTINFENERLEPENISVVDGTLHVLSHSTTCGVFHDIVPCLPAAD